MLSPTVKETKPSIAEYLSSDIMDVDFVRTFISFNRLQFILGSCRIDIKDQFVTSPSRYQKCYTLLCIAITVVFNVAVVELIFTTYQDGAIFYMLEALMLSNFGVFTCIIMNTRFSNGQDNADFFIGMQKVDRLMGLDKIKDFNRFLKQTNNMSTIIVLGAFLLLFLLTCIRKDLAYLCFAGSLYGQLTGIIELSYCSNLLIYFVVRLRFVNCIVKNHLTQNKGTTKPISKLYYSNRYLKKIALETHTFVTSDTSAYIKELFDLFSMFQKLYRFQLFIFCLKLVLGCLLLFGFILISIQKNIMHMLDVFSMAVYTIIDIFIAAFLGIRLQLFFGEVKETKRLSIAVMAAYSHGQLREKARKMVKMAEETPPKLSIYDMYDMDAGTFITIFSLITSIIVTMLQFAFL